MTKEGFFSGLTVVIYSFIAVFSLVMVTIGTVWVTGGFDEQGDPATSLAFSRNTLFLTDTDATISVGSPVEDVRGEEIILWITDLDNKPADIGIVKFTESEPNKPYELTININEAFAVEAGQAVDTDGILRNIGGRARIWARTADGRLRTGTPLTVYVDVPVESITMNFKTLQGADIAASDLNFVEGDEFVVSATVVPARSLRPYGLTSAQYTKTITYNPPLPEAVGQPSKLQFNEATGKITVKGSANTTWDEIITVQVVRAFASVGLGMGNPSDPDYQQWLDEHYAMEEVVISVDPIELSAIRVNNSDPIALDIYKPITLSALNISNYQGANPLVSLGVFLEPDRFSAANPNPLARDIRFLEITCESDKLSVSAGTVIASDSATPNKTWTITPLKVGEARIRIWLSSWDWTESTPFEIVINIDEVLASMQFSSEAAELDIKKQTDNGTEKLVGYEESDFGLNLVNPVTGKHDYVSCVSLEQSKPLSYSKIVYFVRGVVNSDNTVTEGVYVNEFGQEIISVSAYGQVQFINDFSYDAPYSDFSYSTRVMPLNSGTVELVAYLVRTDANGTPIDITYAPITSLDTGTVLPAADAEDSSNRGKYVIVSGTESYGAAGAFRVTVTELLDLTAVSVYTANAGVTAPSFDTPLNTNTSPFVLGLNEANNVDFYVQGNSVQALRDALKPRGAALQGSSTFSVEIELPAGAPGTSVMKLTPEHFDLGTNTIKFTLGAYIEVANVTLTLKNYVKNSSGQFTMRSYIVEQFNLEAKTIGIGSIDVTSNMWVNSNSIIEDTTLLGADIGFTKTLNVSYEIKDLDGGFAYNETDMLKAYGAVFSAKSGTTKASVNNVFTQLEYGPDRAGYKPSFPGATFKAYDVPAAQLELLADLDTNLAVLTAGAESANLLFFSESDSNTGMPKFLIDPTGHNGGTGYILVVASAMGYPSAIDCFLMRIEWPAVDFLDTPGTISLPLGYIPNHSDSTILKENGVIKIALGNYIGTEGSAIGNIGNWRPGRASLYMESPNNYFQLGSDSVTDPLYIKNKINLKNDVPVGFAGDYLYLQVKVCLYVGNKIAANPGGWFDEIPVYVIYYQNVNVYILASP